MKNVTKKVLAMFLATTATISCLAGCGQEVSKQTSESVNGGETVGSVASEVVEEPSLFNVGTLPIVNEPVTLKVLTLDPAWIKASDAGVWKWLEEQTGVHFEVESYTKDELSSKLPLIMATPDQMPDLFLYCSVSDADVLQYGQNGQFLQLDGLIEEYGTNIKTMFTEVEEAYGGAVSADGNIYSLPGINGKPSSVFYTINTRFLENSGIKKVPTTLEELYDAMVIMRNCDANGDGIVGNELLWTSRLKIFKRQALSMVGIKCYHPWQGCIFDDKDGEVYFVPTSEEYRYLLTVLNNMYEIGALDPETFTQTTDEYKDKFYSDLTFIGELVNDSEQFDITGISYVAPFGSAVHDDPMFIRSADYNVNLGMISAYTEYPEICMLVLDYMYSEEATKVSAYGLDGVDYKLVSEEPWVIEKIADDIEIGNGPTCASLPKWIRSDMLQKGGNDIVNTRNELLAEYGEMGWQNYVKLTAEESDSVSVLAADLGLYCDDYFVGFITGNYDIEKDWDEYVKTCESMKAKELTEVYQSAYNRYMGIE